MESSETLIFSFVKLPDTGGMETRVSRVLAMLGTMVPSGHPLAICFAPPTRLEALELSLVHGLLDLYGRGKGTDFWQYKTMFCLASSLISGGQGAIP